MNPIERTLAELVDDAGLAPEVVCDLAQELTVAKALAELRGNDRALDAVRLLAHALEPRRTVWWGQQCLCADGLGDGASADQVELAAAIEAWLAEPTDEGRRALGKTAEDLGLGDPVTCLGLGVFLCEGSLAPPDIPAVDPPPGVCARAVGGALTLACVTEDPANADERAGAFVDLGLALLEFDPPWERETDEEREATVPEQ